MKIHNVRLGFANNSSSTHSLVFVGDRHRFLKDDDVEYAEFGWNFFTAVSESAKKDYLAITLRNNLLRHCTDEVAELIIRNWCDHEPTDGGYIDHQSVMTIPSDWSGKGLDRQFFNDMKDYLLQPGVVILGGNDNTEEEHPLLRNEKKLDLDLPLDEGMNANYVARKDPHTKHWSIFNRDTGAKIRMSFITPSDDPVRSYAPELVDIKITDYCPFGCKFCYMGSTTEGKHADRSHISKLARMLGYCSFSGDGLRVFEVALGGGEPTLHPHFVGILEDFRSNGIVPNFTTMNLAWLRDDRMREKVLHSCGSFAFSATKADQARAFGAAVENYGIHPSKVSIQTILGVVPEWELRNMMEVCHYHHIDLTLLGYKTTGRGKEYKDLTVPTETKAEEVIKDLSRCYKCPRIRIDTLAANQMLPFLKREKIPDYLYHLEEGKFSAYVDAVQMKMGPCSYVESDEMVPITQIDTWGDKLKEEFLRIYHSF